MNYVGLRDADFFEARLQFAIIQERDLHCAIGGQRATENGLHALLDFRVFGASAHPVHALSGSRRHGRLHAIEGSIRGRTAGRDEHDRGKNGSHLHGLAPSGGGVFLTKVIPQIGQLPGFVSWISGCIGQV